MKEIWKDIEGYEGLYQVSSHGRVKSLEREYTQWNGSAQITRHTKEKIRGQFIERDGYAQVVLSKDGHAFTRRVHRLVAKAFIPNPDNLPFVNHKDETPSNNHVENLEWCTGIYNSNYGTRNEKLSVSRRKMMSSKNRPISQITLDGVEIARFESIKAASLATGVGFSGICHVCKGEPFRHTAGGYRWAFVET